MNGNEIKVKIEDMQNISNKMLGVIWTDPVSEIGIYLPSRIVMNWGQDKGLYVLNKDMSGQIWSAAPLSRIQIELMRLVKRAKLLHAIIALEERVGELEGELTDCWLKRVNHWWMQEESSQKHWQLTSCHQRSKKDLHGTCSILQLCTLGSCNSHRTR